MRSFLTPLPRDAITALYVALALGVSLGVIGFLIDMLELWRTKLRGQGPACREARPPDEGQFAGRDAIIAGGGERFMRFGRCLTLEEVTCVHALILTTLHCFRCERSTQHNLSPESARWNRTCSWVTRYGMNDTGLQLGGEPDLNSGHNLNQVSDPNRTMAFATATDFRVTYNSRYKWNFENPNDSKTSNGEIAYRHGDKVLAVYFDGHVGEVSKADFEQIDQSGGKNNAFWKAKP